MYKIYHSNKKKIKMDNQDNTTEYLGAFNLNQETVQAALTDFTLKNSVELQEVVQQAEANDQAVKVQVRWHTEGSFAELHLFRVDTTETTTTDTEAALTDDVEAATTTEVTEDE